MKMAETTLNICAYRGVFNNPNTIILLLAVRHKRNCTEILSNILLQSLTPPELKREGVKSLCKKQLQNLK